MDLNKNYIKKTLFLKRKEKIPSTPGGNLDFSPTPQRGYVSTYFGQEFSPEDMYINVFLTKTCEIFEYVDVKKDEKIYSIDRQLINPYYIDFGFFDSIKRIKINTESDLSIKMVNHLATAYTESINAYSAYSNSTIAWFNDIGYNMLINDETVKIDKVTGKKTKENGLDKLEKLETSLKSTISKAYYFPIDVNK